MFLDVFSVVSIGEVLDGCCSVVERCCDVVLFDESTLAMNYVKVLRQERSAEHLHLHDLQGHQQLLHRYEAQRIPMDPNKHFLHRLKARLKAVPTDTMSGEGIEIGIHVMSSMDWNRSLACLLLALLFCCFRSCQGRANAIQDNHVPWWKGGLKCSILRWMLTQL